MAATLVLFTTAVIVLILVVFICKSKHWFLITFPAILVFKAVIKFENDFTYREHQFLVKISYFCSMVSHFLFATQYLKSSMALPKLFKQVKIEQVEKEAQPDANSCNQFNSVKVEQQINQISEYSNDTTSIMDTLNSCDAIRKA